MRACVWRALLAAVILCGAHLLPSAAAQERQKKVLVLYTTRRDAQIAIIGDRELPRILDAGLPEGVDFYSEYIDAPRFPDPQYQSSVRDALQLKYAAHRFDIVVAMDFMATDFVARFRSTLFADTPVVFFANSTDTPRIANSTGLVGQTDFSGTLQLATQLQPDIRHVFFVSGAAGGEDSYEARARAQLRPFESRLTITYLKNLRTADLETRLATLPKHSIVYYWSVSRDGAGENFHPLQYLDRLAAVSNAPIYSWVDSTIGHGVVGGILKSQQSEVAALAALTLRVLKGEQPESIPVSTPDLNVRQVDWRQLQRWHISEARVPLGVSVLFREPTVFQQYEPYIVSAIGLVLLQAALIGALLVQREHRRRAEQSLRESERHFRMMADSAPVMIWRSGSDARCEFANLRWLEFRGRTLEQEIGDGWNESIHPDDRDARQNTYAQAFASHVPFRMEYRVRRADGAYRWVLDTGVPRTLDDGSFGGFIGSCLDITERKHSEEALSAREAQLRAKNREIHWLANRLMTVQEEERARIARELHDDINQQVALLAMNLALLRPSYEATADHLITDAVDRAKSIMQSLHEISHHLHPARLRFLGLVAALDGLVNELRGSDMSVTFQHDDIPPFVPTHVTVCLYRVAQEAIQNALKHSKAGAVLVSLSGGAGVLQLIVSDNGVGFEMEPLRGAGLGLITMRERLEGVGGSLEIRSTAGAGTHVAVTVPLVERAAAQASSA